MVAISTLQGVGLCLPDEATDCSLASEMAKPPKKPVAQLVSDLGGAQTVAERLNSRTETVRMWTWRNAVPRRVWPEMIAAFPNELTLDKLKAIEARAA